MASPATKSASLASLLLLMVSLAAQPSSQQRQDQLTDLSLQPAPRMIAASWRLLNLSGRVGAFRVKWENVKGSGEKELHRCTVPYLVSDSQQHSTEQCDETPMLLPGTEYNVSLWKLNHGSRPLSSPLQISGRTLPEGPSTPSAFSVVSTAHTVNASWQEPQEFNGVLGPYNISWQCGANTSYELINTTAYTIEGLPAGVECRVRVAASTGAGEGDHSEESVWIPSEDPQAPPIPPARLVAPIVGGVVAVLVTAAIVGGVILWRRGQARKRSAVTAVEVTAPTTTTIGLAELANGNDGEESTIEEAEEEKQFLNAPRPFRPMPSLPVERKTVFSASESLGGHDYCYALAEDLRRSIVDDATSMLLSGKNEDDAQQGNLTSFVDALTQNLAARTNFSSDEIELIRLDIRNRACQYFPQAGNESDGLQIHPGRVASFAGHAYCYPQITKSMVEKILAEPSAIL